MSEAPVREVDGRPMPAPWRCRIAHPPGGPHPRRDPDGAVAAATTLLAALGFDLARPDLVDTPRRMAHALLELTTPPAFELTTFENSEGYDDLVLVEGIPVRSVCEHHVLPFVGVAHIGYLPGERLLGLSKFARMVDFHARRPQTQERLTQQLADDLVRHLEPRGVGVVVEAEHACLSLRGARTPGSRTVTSALHGLLRDDPAGRAEFLALTRAVTGS